MMIRELLITNEDATINSRNNMNIDLTLELQRYDLQRSHLLLEACTTSSNCAS